MARMNDVYDFTADPAAAEGDFLSYTVDHLFGDVWSREALGVAERRLVTIGVLAAQGQIDLLEVQFTAALARGELTEEQLREVVIHLSHYAGWAIGAKVNNVVEAVIARRRAEPAG